MGIYRTALILTFVLGLVPCGCKNTRPERSKHREEVNFVDPSGKKQGPWEIYEDSILIARGSYRDDRPDGLWTYWYPNGMLKEEGHYQQGMKHGMWVEWYPDGDLMWKGEYENGHREISSAGAKAEIEFIGRTPGDNVLIRDSTYRLRIRIQNIPTTHLFVETNAGALSRVDNSDLFMLAPSGDTSLTLAIGYIPSLEFMDFRNLVTEIEFIIRQDR